MGNDEKQAIRQVIERAYIEGIHGTQDEQTVRSGFHEDFSMLVHCDDGFDEMGVDEWLDRLETMKAENPEMWSAETTYTFELIDVEGYAALAKLDVYKGTVHFSKDYMLLYRFETGWRIVSKIFSIPG
ncbi:MAG TPA: hypothetical protein ENN19_08540 [Chloroflexi bacterium]|nr:hypothetical protein [Chloroflexota bacterium]